MPPSCDGSRSYELTRLHTKMDARIYLRMRGAPRASDVVLCEGCGRP